MSLASAIKKLRRRGHGVWKSRFSETKYWIVYCNQVGAVSKTPEKLVEEASK